MISVMKTLIICATIVICLWLMMNGGGKGGKR